MNIIKLAFEMYEAVQNFFGRARKFYYLVALLGYRCGKCNGRLSMIAESRCRCVKCDLEFDPTVVFQRCSACGGVPVLRVRRYYCKDCQTEINSRFVFKTLPFEKGYFQKKMVESRRRKKEQLQQVREMLSQSRSQSITPDAVDLDSVPGLLAVLNGLTQGIDEKMLIELKGELKEMQIDLMLARVTSDVREMLERTGAAETFGREHIHPRVIHGVRAYLQESPVRMELREKFVSEWLFHTIEILSAPISQLSDEHRAQVEELKLQLQELAREIGAVH